MTRGQTIFMFLMICTAVITGATLGVVNNLDIIVQQSNMISASAEAAQSPDQMADIIDNTSPDPVKVADNESVSRSTQLMVITAQEKDEIKTMLQQLGMTEDEHMTDFIRNFQQTHSLNATGILDSQTLNIMIKQVTYDKASRAADSFGQ